MADVTKTLVEWKIQPGELFDIPSLKKKMRLALVLSTLLLLMWLSVAIYTNSLMNYVVFGAGLSSLVFLMQWSYKNHRRLVTRPFVVTVTTVGYSLNGVLHKWNEDFVIQEVRFKKEPCSVELLSSQEKGLHELIPVPIQQI